MANRVVNYDSWTLSHLSDKVYLENPLNTRCIHHTDRPIILQIMKHDSPEPYMPYMPSTCIRPRKIMCVSGFPTDNIETWLTPMFLLV